MASQRNDELLKDHRKAVVAKGWKKICEHYYYAKIWTLHLEKLQKVHDASEKLRLAYIPKASEV